MSSKEMKQKYTPKNTMKQFPSLPSCFLTPESDEKPQNFGRNTPTQDYTSSVFLSPPSSLERKPVPNFAVSSTEDPVKLELDFDDYLTRTDTSDLRVLRSSLMPGQKISRTTIDFITELLGLNCHEICKNICGYLNDRDLSRFASVCQSWRTFSRNECKIRDRLHSYLSQRKEYCVLKGKENLGSPTTSIKLDTSLQNTKRAPLVDIAVNQTSEKERISNMKPQELNTSVTLASEKFRPCPNCSSPSNYAKMLGSHCECQKCGLQFCSKCLYPTMSHKEQICRGLENPQERMETRSKSRRKGKETDVVGSRKNKERMRRL